MVESAFTDVDAPAHKNLSSTQQKIIELRVSQPQSPSLAHRFLPEVARSNYQSFHELLTTEATRSFSMWFMFAWDAASGL